MNDKEMLDRWFAIMDKDPTGARKAIDRAIDKQSDGSIIEAFIAEYESWIK